MHIKNVQCCPFQFFNYSILFVKKNINILVKKVVKVNSTKPKNNRLDKLNTKNSLIYYIRFLFYFCFPPIINPVIDYINYTTLEIKYLYIRN